MSSYVNRWGPQGQQWPSYTVLGWCANTGDATTCATSASWQHFLSTRRPQVPFGPLHPVAGNTDAEVPQRDGDGSTLDGNPLFFPIDSAPNPRHAQQASYSFAEIPQPVSTTATGLPNSGGALHNSSDSTSEIRHWFKCLISTATATSSTSSATTTCGCSSTGHAGARSRRLATFSAGKQSFTISAATAATYNSTNGDVYQIAVFQTERKLYGSSFGPSPSRASIRRPELRLWHGHLR